MATEGGCDNRMWSVSHPGSPKGVSVLSKAAYGLFGIDMRSAYVRDRCSTVVLDLNNRLADCKNGSLIQVLYCRELILSNEQQVDPCNDVKGLPYAVAGVGDLLALFRCISCRFSFSTDIMQPRLLGAVGRVYTTSEPEICGDVQKYDKQIYLRVSEAQRCRVHSTVVIPFFEPMERHRALGVIEVVKNDKGISFAQLLENVVAALESVSLCTSDIDVHRIEEGLKQWPADNDLHLFDFAFDLYPSMTTPTPVNVNNISTMSQPLQMGHPDGRDKMSSLFSLHNPETADVMNVPHAFLGADAVGLQHAAVQSMPGTGLDGMGHLNRVAVSDVTPSPVFQQSGSLVDLNEQDVPGLIGMAHMNAGNTFQAMPPISPDNDQILNREKLEELLHTLTSNKFRKKRRGKMGSGKHLTYTDLKQHFGVGLKEAAAALGICSTTLKRACRRNGISRWPNRHTVRIETTDASARSTENPMATQLDVAYSSPSQPMLVDSATPSTYQTDDLSNNTSVNEEK